MGRKFNKPALADAANQLSDFCMIVINKYQKFPTGEVKKEPLAFGW